MSLGVEVSSGLEEDSAGRDIGQDMLGFPGAEAEEVILVVCSCVTRVGERQLGVLHVQTRHD